MAILAVTNETNGSIFVRDISGFIPGRTFWTEGDFAYLVEFRRGVALIACPRWSCWERWLLCATTAKRIRHFENHYPKLINRRIALLDHENATVQTSDMTWENWGAGSSSSNYLQVRTLTVWLPSFPIYDLFPAQAEVQQCRWIWKRLHGNWATGKIMTITCGL